MTLNYNDTKNKAPRTVSDGFHAIDLPGRYDRTRGSVWILIFLLSLFLHASFILFLWIFRPFSAQGFEAPPPEPIQLVFVEKTDPHGEEPNTFTKLPDDQEDEKPAAPDFLSNIDSRARDMVDGGIPDALPNLTGESEAPHVRLDPVLPEATREAQKQDEKGSTLAESASSPRPANAPNRAFTQLPEEDRMPVVGDDVKHAKEINENSESYEQTTSDVWNKTPSQTIPPTTVESKPQKMSPSLSGTADLYQDAMEFRSGDTALSGIISMNTTRWAYAPWLQRFRRNLMRSWLAPVAYYMGIIHGYTTVELEIAPDGTLMELEIIEEEGHVSLHETSTSLFKVLSPYHPLPPDFPEKSLILRIKLVYPPRR